MINLLDLDGDKITPIADLHIEEGGVEKMLSKLAKPVAQMQYQTGSS